MEPGLRGIAHWDNGEKEWIEWARDRGFFSQYGQQFYPYKMGPDLSVVMDVDKGPTLVS